MNKLGQYIFIEDLKALQLIDSDEKPISGNGLIRPVRRARRRIDKVLNSWMLLVGVAFTAITFKIMIEQLMRLQ